MKVKLYLLFFAASLFVFNKGYGQVTTSSVFGKILDEKKQPLEGATVVFTYVPTGLKYGNTTDQKGGYNFGSMTPGGPYTIDISYIGYQPVKREGVDIGLGNNVRFDFNLLLASSEMKEVNIVANKNKKTAGQEFDEKSIQTTPSISRNITDITKLTPQSNNNSFAGTNFRYNNITLDGAVNNDAIGFSPSLGGISGTSNMPGSSTRSASFSMDAVEAIQTAISPYDVKLGNFTGGSINAVSRSGSNEVTGSIYGYGRGAFLTGPNSSGDNAKMPSSFYDYQTGFRIGLPIIKNKLFFFTNEEIARRQDPVFYGAGSGSFLTAAQAQQITDSLHSATFMPVTEYNPKGAYDPGTNGTYNIHSNSYKFFNRIDYIINDKNQLSIRNNTVLSDATNLERSAQQFQFANYDFTQNNLNVSTVAEAKSRIGNNLSNSAIVGYTYIHDYRTPLGNIFPQVQINNVNGGGVILLGTNREAGIFNMKQSTIELTDNVNWYKGINKFTFGSHNEIYNIDYDFINSWNGRFDYNSLSDFLANKPARMRGIYNLGDNSEGYVSNRTPANFWVMMFSVYAQDEIAVSEKFNLSAGVRLDEVAIPKGPLQGSAQSSYPNPPANYGTTYTTDNAVSSLKNKLFGVPTVSPRVGFNYDIIGKQKVVMRGGTGIFAGRIPFAWLGYAYYNNGSSYGAFDAKTPTIPAGLPTDPTQFAAYNTAVLKKPNTVELDAIDNKFQMPSVWRSNLAFDFKIPGDVKFTIEALYTKVIKDVMLQQANLYDSVKYYGYDVNHQQPVFLGSNKNDANYSSVYLIRNTSKGYRYSFTGQLQKQFNFGLGLSAAYTWGQSKDILNGIRNSPESGWQLNQALNPNNPQLAISNFDVTHRIVATLSFQRSWTKNFTTTIAFVYTGVSGSPFTWVNGNSKITNNGQQVDLAFIPKNQNDIALVNNVIAPGDTVSGATQWQQLNNYISGNKYLNSRRGNFTERNGDHTPWNHNLDMRIMQAFHMFDHKGHRHTLEVSFDMINLTNALNPKWGYYYFVPNTLNSSVLTGLNPNGKTDTNPNSPTYGRPQFTFTQPSSTYSVDQLASRWQGQLGLRYSF